MPSNAHCAWNQRLVLPKAGQKTSQQATMRTRSKANSETIDQKKKGAEKRKRKDDDPALGNGGARNKRCKTQLCSQVAIASESMASQANSPLKRKRHSSADPERAAEELSASSNSKNGEDMVLASTLEKFVGALRKRGAADMSPRKATGDQSCSSLKKAITKKHGTKGSPVLRQPRNQGQSRDHTHTLDDHHGRENTKSTEGGAMEQCSSSLLLHTGVKHHGRDNTTPTEKGSVEQCSSGFGRNVHTLGASTHYVDKGLQIMDTPLSPQEVAGVQCQSYEDVDPTLSKGKTDKCLRHKKRCTSLGCCLEEATKGEQNGSHTGLQKRKLRERSLSCPSSGKSKCHSGNSKQFKNQSKESINTMPTEVSQQLNSCYSRKRLNAAKSRWKNLAQSILSTKISPEILASARSVANSRNYKTLSRPQKHRKPIAAANAQRPIRGRMRQKVRRQQLGLLKRMKTWLTEAKFSQVAKEENSNNVGEEFIMTEDERHAFAQTMVQSCQKNPNMRTVFLESVRMLTLSGLMQAAASNLLRQGPCEEAQNVMNAWADFKEQSFPTKTLPMNLFNSVNQLHGKRGDLSTKLSTSNNVGICTLSQIDEKTWKFQLPGSPLEDFT